ncbi:MAG: lysophospholipid acyltransferase family protein [Phycisphaerales bacterium]
MEDAFYRTARLACRFVRVQCIRQVVLSPQRADRDGGFILAITHLSHLEPFFVGCAVRRVVRWMSRVEFYQRWWMAQSLRRAGAFPVDRFGNSFGAVRKAVRLVEAGEIVGIFPEGGVANGPNSVLRGGPLKGGACTIAIATGRPIVPVVVLGTDSLNRVAPWLPFRRGKVWIAFGNDVAPAPEARPRREDRELMAQRLRSEFLRTYQRLLAEASLRDEAMLGPAAAARDGA